MREGAGQTAGASLRIRRVRKQGEWTGVHSDRPIGVFDSGIGGLSVAAAIAEALPSEQIYYFGDTARCPYGDRTPTEVAQFSTQVFEFLRLLDIKLFVIACNTATAVALTMLRDRAEEMPVLGVIEPGARAAVRNTAAHRIGVIGTAVTVGSGAYANEIRRHDASAQVQSVACPAFVPLVEAGELDGDHVERVVQSSLSDLVQGCVDTLILGCTHYPLLAAPIQRAMGDKVRLISSAAETAAEVAGVLKHRGLLRVPDRVLTRPTHRYFATGSGASMAQAIQRWPVLVDHAKVEEVDLGALVPG